MDSQFDVISLIETGTELGEAKEKLSRADSSSSDSEDEGITKRKKTETTDKPTEEVCYLYSDIDKIGMP